MANELFCPNPNCPLYRVAEGDNIVKFGKYTSKQGSRSRYRCNQCGETFSERAMTGLYGLHADKAKVDKVIQQIKKGVSLRQISRDMEIKLDTVRYWRDRFLKQGSIDTNQGIKYNRPVLTRRQSTMGLDTASKGHDEVCDHTGCQSAERL
jgi:transposase-like protein